MMSLKEKSKRKKKDASACGNGTDVCLMLKDNMSRNQFVESEKK